MLQMSKKFLKHRKAIVLSLMLVGITLIVVGPVSAQVTPSTSSDASVYAYIGASLAVGLACLGSGIAIYGSTTSGAALMAERPEMSVWVLLFAGLGEGLAIYGFVIAILIISKL